MSSCSINNVSTLFHAIPRSSSLSNDHHQKLHLFSSFWPFKGKDKEPKNIGTGRICSAISRPTVQNNSEVFQNSQQVIEWQENMEYNIEDEALKVRKSNEIKQLVETIKSMLGSMDDGDTSISAYDTAWIALVEDINGSGAPQFPSTLQWIANNQLSDGSWGDEIFVSYDRLINTLACLVALKTWNIHPDKYEKGLSFIKKNLSKLANQKDEHMPLGFEVAFTSLLEIAKNVGIDMPYNSPVLQGIYKKRDSKLAKIPKDLLYNQPTTLLYSLEGMSDLDWEKILKLQTQAGSLLSSPSSTAFALMKTKDQKCLNYLTNLLQAFNGGAPNTYPLDLFERLWVVDRLQRLGISRYFQPEIREYLDYAYRYWSDEGISWERNLSVQDIDDTSMGFRQLRLYGYDVSADAFKNFKSGEEFFCFPLQLSQGLTGIFNLYRASQLMFPGETILEEAMKFSSKYLIEKRAANQLIDKWIIAKDLPGEVRFALDVPWYASLPRLETRFYIEQYGGKDDVWIGKTLYRMFKVNNNEYLELAKLDYNNCRAVHQIEWDTMLKWYAENELESFGTGRNTLLLAYFLASASIYEPERSQERIAWAKTSVLTATIASYFNSQDDCSKHVRAAFVDEFRNCINTQFCANGRREINKERLSGVLVDTLNHLALDAVVAKGVDIHHHLHHSWEKWLLKWQVEGDKYQGEAELLAETINLTSGFWVLEELLSDIDEYWRLTNLCNSICHRLGRYQKLKMHENGSSDPNIDLLVDNEMQDLVQIVLKSSSNGIYSRVKQTFLTVIKSLYYAAYCDPATINFHITKVLFEKVE